MVRIKFCGLTRICDIEAVNELLPEYIGFVFWERSRRYITPDNAEALKKMLDKKIKAVGVFVDESPEVIAKISRRGILDVIQLHGHEDEDYISKLRTLANNPIIKAFRVQNENDVMMAESCNADFVMLDAGMGTGYPFDWSLLRGMNRQYFLAGGLTPHNVREAVRMLKPYAVDVSSGIETNGIKDAAKMSEFIGAVREAME